jgi:ribosomal protein S18 acetylase RimI-like enzyme
MPQASLLSYFTKPVTALTPVQADLERNRRAEDHQVQTKHVASAGFSLSRGPGIVDTLQNQGAQSSVDPAECASEGPQHKVGATTPVRRKEELENNCSPTEAASNPKRYSPGIIQIPHVPGAAISPVSEDHLQAIRRLTATTLPVRYSDAFFKTTVTDPVAQQLSRVSLYESEPIGWIRCRLEPFTVNSAFATKTNPPLSQIYIQALTLLSPYRTLGIATLLLNEVLSSAKLLVEDPICIYAHVWERNEDALDWYAKRGFKRVMLVERYYTRLRPSGAWIVRKELRDA